MSRGGRVLLWDGRSVYFSGGPQNGELREFSPDHPLITQGAAYYVGAEPLGQHVAVIRRGIYARVGNLALWWGWEGFRPEVLPGHG